MDKNKTAYKLLKLLANGRFHSGQELGRILGITRSGVWKALQQLEHVGIELHAVTGKGYRIPHCIELLEAPLIQQQLHAESAQALNELTILTSTPSTNDHLLKLVKQRPRRTIACLAEHQTAGRGTSGREWVSGFGSSLSLSLLWHFHKDPSEMLGLSLAIGVAVVRALTIYGISNDIQLKWPNDILWQQKKLAGILIELVAESHSLCSVVIGVGLNVNMPSTLGQHISQPWTQIAEITQQAPSRNQLAGILLNQCILATQEFGKKGLAPFIPEWRNYDSMINKPVTVTTLQHQFSGIMRGISARGELVLETENNEIHNFLTGQASLRLTENGVESQL